MFNGDWKGTDEAARSTPLGPFFRLETLDELFFLRHVPIRPGSKVGFCAGESGKRLDKVVVKLGPVEIWQGRSLDGAL